MSYFGLGAKPATATQTTPPVVQSNANPNRLTETNFDPSVTRAAANALPSANSTPNLVNPSPLTGAVTVTSTSPVPQEASKSPSPAEGTDATPTPTALPATTTEPLVETKKPAPVVSYLSDRINAVRLSASQAFTRTNANPILVAAVICIIATLMIGVITALCLSGAFPPPYQGGMIGCCCAVAGSFVILVASSTILYLCLRPQPKTNLS